MAAVSGLVRRPLEQVGSGARPLRDPCPLASPLSILPVSSPGLRAAEEALPPVGAGGAAGNCTVRVGQGASRPRAEAGIAPALRWVGVEGWGRPRVLEANGARPSCVGFFLLPDTQHVTPGRLIGI